jgi:hypothetical protein
MTSIARVKKILDSPSPDSMSKRLTHAMTFMIEPALSLLPQKYNSIEAKAMLLTIPLQESKLVYRRKIKGPAKSFYQFERNGVAAVLKFQPTIYALRPVLDVLNYASIVDTCYDAVEHNDILACVFSRLLMWSSPLPLPKKHEPEKGWDLYLATWRPGKPKLETWNGYFNEAWNFLTR